MFQTGKETYGNYQGASGIKGFGVFDTLKFMYQHRNDTLMGMKTYGVDPFSHPIYSLRLHSNIKTLKKQGTDTLQHISDVQSELDRFSGSNY